MENHELTEEEIDEIQESFYEVNLSYYQPWERELSYAIFYYY